MNTIETTVGDTPKNKDEQINPFDLHVDLSFRQWLAQEQISLAFTTYEAGKLIIIGPGLTGGTIITERNFERCMALHIETNENIWLSTHHNIIQLENGLEKKQFFEGQWDRVYLPRTSLFTGGVDIHDIARGKDGYLYGVVTGYNCIARITPDEKGSFSPFWKPDFIDEVIAEDRCHLNGFCFEDGELAYVSLVGKSNEFGKWREAKAEGGMIIDTRSNEVVANNLSMPHTPRLYSDGSLWFLEAGKGYLCRLDPMNKAVEKKLWLPGFLRGLRFYKNFALICCSAPRDKTFDNLPLEQELKNRNIDPKCALYVVDMNNMEVVHSLEITGHVKEIYDVAALENCTQPLLHGLQKDDVRRIVVLGKDYT